MNTQKGGPERKVEGEKSPERQTDPLDTLNGEIVSLIQYLEKHNVCGRELDAVTDPLVKYVTKSNEKKYRLRLMPVCAFLLICSVISCTQFSCLSKFATVLMRKGLLWMLPFWDWTRIYYSDCVLTNPFYVPRALKEEDCNVCESLEHLDRLSNASMRIVTEEYLNNDLPFVVTDAMDNWSIMNTDNFWFDNLTEIYLSEDLIDTYPCVLTTNLRLKPRNLRTFLKRIHDPDVQKWYGFWENCDKKAAKALRHFYKRPYFIPNMVDLSESNWVLLSSNYKGKIYKQIDFNSELLMVAQIRGWSNIRLVPREPCNHYCPELVDSIAEGHMIIIPNPLWMYEYIPGENTDNLAIAVGGFWN